jgi:Bacterial pre-peptidase C-terminal domain
MLRRIPLLLLIAFLVILPGTAQDKKKPEPKKEPQIRLAIPLAAVPGKVTKLTLRGKHLDDAREVKIDAALGSVRILNQGKADVPDKNPEKVGDTRIEVELKLNDTIAGESVSLIVVTPAGETKPHPILVESKLPVLAEKEPNDGFRMAQLITPPLVLDGTIGRANDVDVFRLNGKRGQKLYVEMLASRHGSPLDAMLHLYGPNGEQLAGNDDFDKAHHDAKIEFTLPEDGAYYLSLSDAHGVGGSLHVYRLLVK